MQPRRSRHEITLEILKTCVGGARKTKIVYRTNANFRVIMPHLIELEKKGLLIKESHSATIYTTTDKGLIFIKKMDNVLDFLQD
jgi:predicted transcriptional regulator